MQELSEYGSTALHFTHIATGLELFHLHNNDRENLFAFVFRTPPNDDTGVAHILEHSVLCGSELDSIRLAYWNSNRPLENALYGGAE
ncbi:MAG: hypothetical protein GH155_05610 [Spirochaeta sp.]|nr:hypothetical protein [Spirochaeta sp.]